MSETSVYDAAFSAWEHPVITAQNAVVTTLNESSIFPLAYLKAKQLREKRQRMAGRGFKRVILLTEPPNLINVSDELQGFKIEKIPTSQFMAQCEEMPPGGSLFDHCLVILTNNVLAFAHPQRFAAMQKKTPQTWYAIHDYDNHHWHEMSAQCALLADTYFPAHYGDISFATRLEANIVLGVPIRSIQWKKDFVVKKIEEMLEKGDKRLETPDGWHAPYAKFAYRNSVVQKLSETYPDVGFTSAENFHALTPEEKWDQWVKHRYHFIVPTNHDIPIRFFDSLITMGIAVIPRSLKPILHSISAPEENIFFYDSHGLSNPNELLKLENLAPAEILNKKHLSICNSVHVDESINVILRMNACIH